MYPHWRSSFVLLWTGQACSILTSSISQYALLWYLAGTTGSAATLSLATIFIMLPQGVLSLFTGSFADRYDRRFIMALSDGAIGLVSLFLALAAGKGGLSIGLIFGALALRSVGAAFHTPCIQAVTPLIAPAEALTKCAGWSQGITTVSALISPALAALLYANLPLPLIIALDTLGAALAVLFLLLARLPVLLVGQGAEKNSVLQDSLEGFRVLRRKQWLWELCLICALFSIAFLPLMALFPLMSMDYFGRNENAAALVETAFSVGMLLGSVILGLWGGTKNKLILMTASILGLAACLIAVGFLPPSGFWLFVLLSFLMAPCAPFFNAPFTALIQEKVEPEYLGRVLGISGAIMSLASPLGLLVTTFWGDLLPLPVWFLLSGLVILLCGVLCIALPSVRNCDKPSA